MAGITEYGEVTVGNLTERGEIIAFTATETGALVFYVATTLLKQVSDSLSVTDDVKAALKILLANDSLKLVDETGTPVRVLSALDSVGALEGAFLDRVLLLSETVSLAEVVEGGGKRKTKLFLVLGDFAIQLSGD